MRLRYRAGRFYWPMRYLLDSDKVVIHWVGPYPSAHTAVMDAIQIGGL